ncbi:uncharacterized protein KY384_007307 [Bacidia gigantensis]|uniref:uncharacterized protein n=1 Tax=Bacidia gigantensis TaxID=2732470 RepID=UPI001D05AE9E|nr:uncharacterized protein KY384_007307 [Bacidia gigantensis]KAG8528389.1 hypothetical protein KY384_007307 [Bacidia gigantensis]
MVYEDNLNRSQRVTDLVNNSAMIQSEMKTTNANWKEHDTRAYGFLTSVAKAAGYPSPKEYIDAAADKVHKDLTISLDVLGGLFAVCMTADIVTTQTGRAIFSCIFRFFGWRALANAIAVGVQEGEAAEASLEIIAEAFEVTQVETKAAQEAGIIAEVGNFDEFVKAAAQDGIAVEVGPEAAALTQEAAQGAKQASQGLRYFKLGLKIFNGLAALASIGILAYELVEGAKQKKELHSLTVEYFAKRFSIKQAQLRLEKSFQNIIDMQKLIVDEDVLNGLVTDGTITAEQKKTKMEKYVGDMKGAYLKSFTTLKDQDAVDALAEIDKTASSWTNEDPDMTEAKQWLKDNPEKPADTSTTSTK